MAAVPSPDSDGFAALGLRAELQEALAALGYEAPTPIQRGAIPALLEGRDLLGQAATGTGKTAAFALPVLHSIEPGETPHPVCLVLTPTRELAVQVADAMGRYGRRQGVRVLAVYGGQPIGRQLGALERGVHVVVATPGRALDHLRRGSLDLSALRTVVLDEADEMLDMGFSDEIEEILAATPARRQTVLFSATMPPRILAIARRHQHDPCHVRIGADRSEQGTVAPIEQRVYFVERRLKARAIGRILDMESPGATLVFCRTRSDVDELTSTLNARGYRAESLHGGMDQQTRDRVVVRLRDGTAQLLVATDVAARGLDVDTLTHVVNHDLPSGPESYTHRIGRVGRAGRDGVAITLAEPRQRPLIDHIERATGQPITTCHVPSVAELRSRQLEVTAQLVRDELAAVEPDGDADDDPDTDAVGLLDALADEADLRAIALAALGLVHRARHAQTDDTDIPPTAEWVPRGSSKGPSRRTTSASSRGERRAQRPPRSGHPDRSAGAGADADTGFVFVGAGRNAKVRPGDLVGAVANETGLSGREIGPIRITERYSVVGVPADAVDHVVQAMSTAMVRGKRVKVARYLTR